MEDLVFGIISEGPTDQVVLKNILFGYTENKDLDVRMLQPKVNETGNWCKVFDYCCSSDFKNAFAFCDIVIVQIDTDFMLKGEVAPKYYIDIQQLDVAKTVAAFQQKIIELIGKDFYEAYAENIVFAISVHEIECWLLPLYFPNQKKKAAKTESCLAILNKALKQKEGFYINAKNLEYYEAMAKHFRKAKKKDIEKMAVQNPSFEIFMLNLEKTLTQH